MGLDIRCKDSPSTFIKKINSFCFQSGGNCERAERYHRSHAKWENMKNEKYGIPFNNVIIYELIH